MIITFFGVRGSLPTPGAETVRYGGNTSCVHVKTRTGRDLIFDAGTGIRRLGKRLAAEGDRPINIYLTHSHWDHIQGFPFFDPIFQPEREIRVCPPFDDDWPGDPSAVVANGISGPGVVASVLEQMNGHNFPIDQSSLVAKIDYAEDAVALSHQDQIDLARQPLNHPGGGYSYRVDEDGCTFAYVTDNELDPPNKASTTYDQWVEHLRGVDVLVHDAQYREHDMPDKHGWGHSLISQVRQLAHDAEVSCLVLYHHDPTRSDDELDEVRLESEKYFRDQRVTTRCLVAREGLTLQIEPQSGPVGRRVKVL